MTPVYDPQRATRVLHHAQASDGALWAYNDGKMVPYERSSLIGDSHLDHVLGPKPERRRPTKNDVVRLVIAVGLLVVFLAAIAWGAYEGLFR